MNGLLIALIVILSYFAVLIVGSKLKLWEKISFSVKGPLLFWQTRKGRDFIERIGSRERFWTVYGRIATGICFGTMVILLLLLGWNAVVALSVPRSMAPDPELLIGIPGINPIIPIGYGILGLAVSIMVHEFAHGILSRAGRIKIESLGLVFFIFPIAAFVEPNEEEVKNAHWRRRSRLFAAGPATNMILAFICFLLFIGVFAPAAEPTYDGGAVAVGIARDSPADRYELNSWSQILSIDGSSIDDVSEFEDYYFETPGEMVMLEIYYRGSLSHLEIPGGVVVSPAENGPAYEAGVRDGMIISSLNEFEVHNASNLREAIREAPVDVPIEITALDYSYDPENGTERYLVDESISTITLTTKWEYYEENYPGSNEEEFKDIPYMGVTITTLGIAAEEADYVLRITAGAFSEVDDLDELTIQSLRFIALPFWGYSPVNSPMSDLYEPSGAMAAIPDGLYWVLTNSLYWIFWINLMLGLFNALPAVPLDGGYIFKDYARSLLVWITGRGSGTGERKSRLTNEQIDKVINRIVLFISLAMLFLIIWPILIPRF